MDVKNLAGGSLEKADKDGNLLAHQERGKGHAKEDSQVLDRVPYKHFDCQPSHAPLQICRDNYSLVARLKKSEQCEG